MEQIRILVVEDDVELRETLEEVLSDEGYEVVTAERGEDAVRLATEQLFDLVVTDIKMPGIDGLEALEQVKQRQPEVKSLVVTGYSSHQDAVRAVRMGVGEYLQKPFGLDSLLARISEMVKERRAELAEKKKEDSYLQALTSALRLAAEFLDPRLLQAADMAESLASRSTAGWAKVTTLALGCRQQLSEEKQLQNLGPKLEGFLKATQEQWDGSGPDGLRGEDIPLASQIAALSLQTALEPDKNPKAGSFKPELLARLKKPSIPTSKSTDLRSLLTLAQAFERGGDLENAHLAYNEILDVAGHSVVAFEAALGTARLERAIHGDRLPTLVTDLIALSEKHGPQTVAKAQLEGGLLLLPSKVAREHLERARELCQEAKDDLGLARAELGLASLGVEVPISPSLELLLKPEHIWELADAAAWMLPWLLQSPGIVKSSMIVDLLREAPQALQACLEADVLTLEQKLHAIDILRATEAPPPGVVRILSADRDPQIQRALEPLHKELRAANAACLRLQSFGPFTVSRGDFQVDEGDWKHQKVKYLLAYLAKNWRSPVPDDQLMEEFWPGPADRAKRSLYQATYNLRRTLKDPDSPGTDYIRRERGRLSLNPDLPVWNDFKELEEALNGGCHSDNKAMLSRALRLYRSPYLEQCYMDWAVSTRGSLELRVMEALEWLARDYLKNQEPEAGYRYARQLHGMDPLNQSGQLLAMEGLIAQKDIKGALGHFDACADLLRRELNLEPSLELLKLQQVAKMEDEHTGLIG